MYHKKNANDILKDKRIKNAIHRIILREIVLLADRPDGCTAKNKHFIDVFGFGVNSVVKAFQIGNELDIIFTESNGNNRVSHLVQNKRKLLQNKSLEALAEQKEALILQIEALILQKEAFDPQKTIKGRIRKETKRNKKGIINTHEKIKNLIKNEKMEFIELSEIDYLKKEKISDKKEKGIYDILIVDSDKFFMQSDGNGICGNIGLYELDLKKENFKAIGFGGKHRFINSPFYDLDIFIKYAKLTRAYKRNKNIDLENYYNKILNWFESNNNLELNWMNVFERFVTNDESQKNKPKNVSNSYNKKPQSVKEIGDFKDTKKLGSQWQ